jgi:hypothetical protein
MSEPTDFDLSNDARRVLDGAWIPDLGYSVPHRSTYPHLWLWDSCFHSLGWLGLEDDRCVDELKAIFVAQTARGFVPHMRYLGRPTYKRGPRMDASSLTQPPVYGLVIERLIAAGYSVPPQVIDAAIRGVDYLWNYRRSTDDLVTIFHPWESERMTHRAGMTGFTPRIGDDGGSGCSTNTPCAA